MRSSARHGLLASLALVLGAAAAPAPTRAQGAISGASAALEQQVDALGDALSSQLEERSPLLAEIARRVRISGSASGVWWIDAQRDNQLSHEHTEIWDARFFLDVLLAENVAVGGRTWLRSAAVSAEWDLIRIGRIDDEIGEAYLELQGVGDSSWLNAQLGRFQIPIGESYLRYSKGARDNPFVTNGVAGAWWWDEGAKLYGSDASGRFGYVASLTNGETPRDFGFESGDQYTLKLYVNPTSWLHVSVSGLYSGHAGDSEHAPQAALWLGESWAQSFGLFSGRPNFVDGAPVPDGPRRLTATRYLGADLVATHPAGARLWLSYGHYDIDSRGPHLYDRTLHSWLAELVLEGRIAMPELRTFYLALRANGLGTYDDGRGYLVDVRTAGSIGYNARSLEAYSAALGWRATRWTTLKLEYTHQRFALVRGARGALRGAPDADFVVAELAVAF